MASGLRTFLWLSCLALSIACNAECREAKNDEVPHGANTLIELREQSVALIFGTVFLGTNPDPARDVVVEVYRREENQDFQKTVQQGRLVACVTGSDGGFSFPELKSGRYLLRVGTAENAGINETYAPIILKSKGASHKGKGIEVKLELGT